MPILFDTGVCERLRRREKAVELMARRFYPPVICMHVAGELLYGWVWARIPAEALLAGREFIESFEILAPSLSTASIYGRIRAATRRVGKQLPDPDYWIAAHAIENRMPLATMDSHFKEFDALDFYLI